MNTEDYDIKKIAKLNEDNYESWAFDCKLLLLKDNLINQITTAYINPIDPQNLTVEEIGIKNKNDKAYATIGLTIGADQKRHIKTTTNAFDAWEALRVYHTTTGLMGKTYYRKKMYQLRDKNESLTVSKIISELSALKEKYIAATGVFEDDEFLEVLLTILPEAYDTIISTLEATPNLCLADAIKRILREEMKINEKMTEQIEMAKKVITVEQEVGKALQTNDRNRYVGRRPEHGVFKRLGKRIGERLGSKPKDKQNCFNCGKPGHWARDCWYKDDKDEQDSANYCFMTNDGSLPNNHWTLDSGATKHMTFRKDLFVSFVEQKCIVKVATDASVTAEGVGTVLLKINNGKTLVLKNTLYVPKLSCNLISVSRLVGDRYLVNFNLTFATIEKGRLKMFITLRNGLYTLKMMNETARFTMEDKNDVSLWHKRLGHSSHEKVKRVLNKVDPIHYFCSICTEAKLKATKFPKESEESAAVLDVIVSDVGGPYPKSCSGMRYMISFCDVWSSRKAVYFMKRKAEALTHFRNYRTEVENFHEKKIKIFRTDNGGEYCSHSFRNYLLALGVVHQKTIPYTPQQNGVAERWNSGRQPAANPKLSV